MESKSFKSAASFRRWLETKHSRQTELWIRFFRKDSGRGGITYPEALEEALCFGWIDGVRKRLDEQSYVQRFTPRRPRSNWSRINIEHVERLKNAGRMAPAGLEAYAARSAARSGIYSFENAPRELGAAHKKQFRAHRAAWAFFQKQPPGYRRLAVWWVTSARKPETRARRLNLLIEHSANGRRVGPAAKPKVARRT